MSNVGCETGAATSWIETNEAVKMPPHRFYIWCLETVTLMAFSLVAWSGSSIPKNCLTNQTLIHLRGRKTVTFSRDRCRQSGLAGSGTFQREGSQKHSFSAFQRRYCMSFPLGITWAFQCTASCCPDPRFLVMGWTSTT